MLGFHGTEFRRRPPEQGQLGQGTPAGKTPSWKEAVGGCQAAPGTREDV